MGTVVTGPATLSVEAPLHVVPLFIRDGSGIDLGDLLSRYADAMERAERPPNLAELLRNEF